MTWFCMRTLAAASRHRDSRGFLQRRGPGHPASPSGSISLTHNVLHIVGTGRSEGAAIARMVATLARGLDRDKYLVHAWFLDGDGPLADELRDLGIPVRLLPWSRSVRDPRGAWRYATSLRNTPIAIVHQHTGGRLTSWLARRLTGAPLIYHLHTRVREAHDVAPRRIKPPRAQALIAVSEAVAQCVDGPQPRVVHPGVAVSQTSIRRRSNTTQGGVIGFAGRLAPVKGLIYLLRAVALLVTEFPAIHLEIAGEGPQREAIEAEAVSLGIRERVHLLGWRPNVELPMADWDICVMPSLDEGLGVVALEAMAVGLPLVASAVGGLSEIVVDGCTGWLVPPADPDALAMRLAMLLRDPRLRCAMAEAGRKQVQERFSVEAMTAAVASIYEEVLAARGRA
jgi:glycosyltransferase involved in cell wall biosynthesis